jgi:hypothetical protein
MAGENNHARHVDEFVGIISGGSRGEQFGHY